VCVLEFQLCSNSMKLLSILLFVKSSIAGDCIEDDIAIWRGDYDFTIKFKSIAVHSRGDTSKAYHMFRKQYPAMTPKCSRCHAEMIGCGASNCIAVCESGPASVACKLCIRSHCTPTYRNCIGCTAQDLPLEPNE